MHGTMLYGAGDIRLEDVAEPKIEKPTDAILRISVIAIGVDQGEHNDYYQESVPAVRADL